MSLKPYSSYVASRKMAVPRIPAHWSEMRLGYVLSVQSGDLVSADEFKPEGFPVFGGNGFRGFLDRTNTKAETLLIGRVGALCGNVHHVKEPVWATEHAFRVRFRRKAYNRFFYYVLTSLNLNQFAIKTAQPLLNSTIVEQQSVVVPPIHEQQAIADFLDRETAKIDSLITKQQELIERIEEHKRAYVFAGVTKGIDPAAAFKSSGVAWLGDVPEHWEIRPLKRFVQFHAGAGFPDAEQGLTDEELPFFKVKDLGARGTEDVLTTTDNAISRETAKRLRAYVFPSKSIVMAKIGAALLLNRFRMVGVECCLDNNMLGIECDQRQMEPDFALMLMGAVLDMRMLVNPGAVPSLNETRLGRLMVAAPSLAEQRSIVGHLRTTTAELNRLRQAAVRVVESLQERRSALITAAITGQIEVASGMVAEAAA